MNIAFNSNHDGGWQGNGFGTTPNSYTVTVDGDEVGQISKRESTVLGCWAFYRRQPTIIDGVDFEYEVRPSVTADRLPALKSKVLATLSAHQRITDCRAALDDARADYNRAASRLQAANAAHTDALCALDSV